MEIVACPRSIMPAICTVVFLVFMPDASGSQLTSQEEHVVTVGRVAECAFLFRTLGQASPEPEVKKNFTTPVTGGCRPDRCCSTPDRYKAIIDDARYSIVQITTHHYRREFSFLLRNCKSFNDVNGIDRAVQELTF
jgi:hypothetical protein